MRRLVAMALTNRGAGATRRGARLRGARFDESALPGKSGNRAAYQPDSMDIQACLSGQSLTRGGFTEPFERHVILRVSCHGVWCGGSANGPHLAFLNQGGRQWIMQLGLCVRA